MVIARRGELRDRLCSLAVREKLTGGDGGGGGHYHSITHSTITFVRIRTRVYPELERSVLSAGRKEGREGVGRAE